MNSHQNAVTKPPVSQGRSPKGKNLPRQMTESNLEKGAEKKGRRNIFFGGSHQSEEDSEDDDAKNPFNKHLKVSKSPVPPLRH